VEVEGGYTPGNTVSKQSVEVEGGYTPGNTAP